MSNQYINFFHRATQRRFQIRVKVDAMGDVYDARLKGKCMVLINKVDGSHICFDTLPERSCPSVFFKMLSRVRNSHYADTMRRKLYGTLPARLIDSGRFLTLLHMRR